jgi:CRISPR-associated protein Csh2
MSFKNRVFGSIVVKSINSNYNADFSHQPRTLPDGTVYATDKSLKYAIKNYLKDVYSDENIFYFKRFDKDFKPLRLESAYNTMFKGREKPSKQIVAKDLLSCLDIKFFGATFAMKAKGGDNIAISIHGPLQINHGVNVWHENNIFSEQIMSPFADKEGAEATTLGRQSKLQEGHYLHHFSINPSNLKDILALAGEDANRVSSKDVKKMKDAMCKGVTYYDSAAKAGTDNELVLWIQMKEDSKVVLPNTNSLITKEEVSKDNGKITFDFSRVKTLLEKYKNDLEAVEIYFQPENTKILNAPSMAKTFDLN